MGNEHKNKQGPNTQSTGIKAPSTSAGAGPGIQLAEEQELLRLTPQELMARVRKAESDKIKMTNERGDLVKDINHRVQMYMGEIRSLKERNQRLQDDNQELRDLCCFLDDDRQKGRKLAREWQRFGRYTASVMRQEVANYQGKLHELESRQQELVKDNLELKDLCLYLDEERVSVNKNTMVCCYCGMANSQGQRDEGDGSSSSTNNDEGSSSYAPYTVSVRTNSNERLLEENYASQKSFINEQVLQYIRSLERRIHQLEDQLSPVVPPQKPPRLVTESGKIMLKPLQPPPYRKPPCPPKHRAAVGNIFMEWIGQKGEVNVSCRQPETVMHAMKVLEVYEKLEKEEKIEQDFDLADGEKALVKEMCNVVWRKLEEGPESA